MRRLVRIKLFARRHTDAWNHAFAAAVEWNREHVHKFNLTNTPFLMFPDADDPEVDEALRYVEALESQPGIKVTVVHEPIYDEGDYAAADLVALGGISLDSPDGATQFVANEDAALGPVQPCPTCGWTDPYRRQQHAPFEIREALLDQPATTNDGVLQQPPPGGWEIVNLPNGHKAISPRVGQLLRDAGNAFETRPLVAHDTKRASERVAQLLATEVRLVPCLVHTKIDNNAVCATCGRFIGQLHGPIWFPRAWFADRALFSRDASRGALIYLSNGAYTRLRDAGVAGLAPFAIASLCDCAAG